MAEGLKINVSADVSQATNSLKQVSTEARATGVAFENIDGRVKSATTSVEKVATVFKSTATDTKNFGSALGDARDKVETLRAKIELLNKTALQGSPGKALSKDLSLATAELKTLEKQAGISGTAIGNPLTKGFSAIRQLAYILPGIGIAGIFNLIGEGLVAAATGATKLSEEATEAKKATDKLAESLTSVSLAGKEAAAGQSGNIATVKDLAAAVVNGNLSYKERQRALDELKQTNKAYFGDLTLETATYGRLTALVNEYSKAIINQAITKKFSDVIADTAKAVADADDNTSKAKTKLNQALAEQAKAEDNVRKAQGRGSSNNAQGINSGVVDALNARDVATRKVKETEKSLADAQTVFTKLTEQRADAENKLNKSVLEGIKLKDVKPLKDTTDADLNKQISAINKEIAALESLQKQGLATRLDVQKLFSLKIEKVDLELPKSGFTQSQANALKTQLEIDAQRAFRALPVNIKLQTTKFILPEQQSPFALEFPTPTVVIDTAKALKSAVEAGKGAGNAIKEGVLTGARVGIIAIGENIDKLVNDSVKAGVADLAASIGDAFSGGGFDSVLRSIGNSVGQFIIDLGKILIQSGIEIKGIQAAIKALALSPVAAIAAGIAAIAIGTIIKNASSKSKRTAFAEGGIVTGPTNALIGEAGPEVVFPLAKLKSFLGGMQPNNGMQLSIQQVDSRISGGDIYQAWQLAQVRRGRGVR